MADVSTGRPPPAADDYLTDGKRLVQVLGIDLDGNYALEDIVSEEVESVSPSDLAKNWEQVKNRG